jgi:hypothetical protein
MRWDEVWTKAQAWGCPCHPKKYTRGIRSVSDPFSPLVGLWSMYFVVMPRVNLIVILMKFVCYLYSINCPNVICLPSMLLFILWRDTTSELWTPVHSFTLLLPFTVYLFYLYSCKLLPLFTTNRWDWQPHCKLRQSTWLCCVQVLHCCWCKATPWTSFLAPLCGVVTKLAGINLQKFGSFSYWFDKPWFHN